MRIASSKPFAFATGIVLALAACQRAPEEPGADARHYEARGIIRGLAPDGRAIDIEHEDIPGFMPSMTMTLPVRDRRAAAGFAMGDAVSFRLSVTENDSWIDHLKKIDIAQVHLPSSTAAPRPAANTSPRLRDGDVMPPFELTDQDGRKISLETFHGHPLVLTFIFTRCPIPNFCPLMSKNFAVLQNAIKQGSGRLAQTRLLSISFDPDFDTPQVLKSYAGHAQADPVVWTFATGAKTEINDLTHGFSVYVQQESGTISHGLATVLIDQDGKIVRIWRGNGWAPSEILDAIRTGSD
jgi:protein SCO1/2